MELSSITQTLWVSRNNDPNPGTSPWVEVGFFTGYSDGNPPSTSARWYAHYLVYINGAHVATFAQPGASRILQSGSETANTENIVHSGTGALQWSSILYGWISGWSGGGTSAVNASTGGMPNYFSWYITNISAVDGWN